jgi:hypothetical protein
MHVKRVFVAIALLCLAGGGTVACDAVDAPDAASSGSQVSDFVLELPDSTTCGPYTDDHGVLGALSDSFSYLEGDGWSELEEALADSADTSSIPVQEMSWGRVKSLYR